MSGIGTTRSRCRTPWNIVYETRSIAKQAVRESRQKVSGQLRPYQCSCGHWHLTHLTKRAAKQIQRHRNMAA